MLLHFRHKISNKTANSNYVSTTKAAAAESHRMHVMHAMLSVHMHAQRKNDDADVTIIYVSTCLRLILGIYFYPHTIDTRAVFT